MKIAYVRVSTVEQNEERQVEALSTYGIEKWFVEKVSGKDTNRPKLQEMLNYIREGDTLYVHDFSRLARSTADLMKIIDILKKKDVVLISNKENFDTSTATGKLLLTMIAAINEFERENLLERQREGIAIAKAKGKYQGRKKITKTQLNDWEALYLKFQRDRNFSKSEFARRLKISRSTLERLLAEEEQKQKKHPES